MTTATGETLTTVDGRTALRMERRLAHPPPMVWRALTEPGRLTQWFPSDVEMEPRAGGKVRFPFRHGEGEATEGEVAEWNPPHVLAYTWDDDVLRWELEPESLGTVLVLTHTFADRPGAASFAAGWDACISRVDPVLAGGPVPARGDMKAAHERYVKEFGLDRGAAEELPVGWKVRFERQLTQPAATVWRTLLGGVSAPEVGGPVPRGFVAGEFAAGPVSELRPQEVLAYPWDLHGRHQGTVRWELTRGTGQGARLVLTQTGLPEVPASLALDVWRDRVESLAAKSAAMPR
ncbi:SRPBCC family protein [Actinacidiphila sp. bgisy167]|uniref:SRPBCC family protein n=1 Tax=Actinacidiphila sp. bgisy167 TaxID=3413797 RepID=UPI003D71FD25